MRVGRAVMGTLYIAAGLAHFVATRMYVGIMPEYLPAHRELVLLSGAAEIAGGVGVLVPQTQRAAAWGLVVLLVAVDAGECVDGAASGAVPGGSGVGDVGEVAAAGGASVVGLAIYAKR